MKLKKFSSINIEFVVFLLTAIFCSTPRLSDAVMLLFILVSSFFIILKDRKLISKKAASLTLLIIIYIALILLYKINGVSDAVWGRYAVYIYLEFQVLLMIIVPYKIKSGENNLLWWSMLMIIGINIAWNVFIIYLHPEFNEAWHYIEEETLATLNVGASDFHVMSLIFFDICFFVYLNCKSGIRTRYAMLFFTIISAIYIIGFCYKASVVVFFILSFVLLLVSSRVKSSGKLILLLIALSFVGAFIIISFQDSIINFIVGHSPSERLTKRLVMLVDANDVNASDNSFNARQDLWYSSLNVWLSTFESFLFGIGDHWGNMDSGIGHHSELFDTLAKYGLIGGILLGTILYQSFKFMLSCFDYKYRLQIMMIILIYLGCGFTKRIFHSSVGLVFYLLLPMAAMLVNKKTVKSTSNNMKGLSCE